MEMANIDYKTSKKAKKDIFIKSVLSIIGAFIFALLAHDTWVNYLGVYHTILEIICVFMAISVFMAVWYNYERSFINTCLLAFGFLAVAIFDALHAFYFLKLDLTISSYFDLSTRFWVFGRLAQAITIFLSTYTFRKKTEKRKGLFLTLLVTSGISFLSVNYHDFLPILLTDKGVTPIKMILEYVIILLLCFGLYRYKVRIHEKNTISYTYIILSIVVMIPSELFFAFYYSVNSITWTIGHVLKITSYYFLYRGVFASTIIYSFDRLEEKHKELEEAYIKLEQAHNEIDSVNETLDCVLDAMPVAVLKYDLDGRIKYINKKFEEMFDCRRKDLNGITSEQFLQKYYKPEYNEKSLFNVVMENPEDITRAIRTLKSSKDGYKKTYLNSRKISSGVLILANDATEEQALQNLHLQTETILNSLSNGVLMIDNNKNIILCNRALEELLEMEKESIIGMHIEELNRIVKYDGLKVLQNILHNEKAKKMHEATITTLKGNKKDVHVYANQIKNIDGEIIGAISISDDITKHKEEQLRMQQQEKLALLGQLGAGIVHETRNYLTTIKGRSQLVEVLAKDEVIKSYAVKINEDVNEVNRIISEFLFLSKPRQTELQEISMYDIFDSIKHLVETSSLVKGVSVDLKISKEERYLLCDEVQVKQVILNICKNAVEAMEDSSNPKLVIETLYDEIDNEAIIKIKDNGKGISPEDLNKIGTMFHTTKKTGTGLGLNVCYQIIKEHKGKIELESELGKGTTFTIILPCIPDDELEEVI